MRDDLGYPTDKPSRRLLDRNFAPRAGKKEKHNVCSVERGAFMRSCSNMQVPCNDRPSAFPIERFDPFHVSCISREFFTQGDYIVVVVEQCMQTVRDARAQVIVQQ